MNINFTFIFDSLSTEITLVNVASNNIVIKSSTNCITHPFLAFSLSIRPFEFIHVTLLFMQCVLYDIQRL